MVQNSNSYVFLALLAHNLGEKTALHIVCSLMMGQLCSKHAAAGASKYNCNLKKKLLTRTVISELQCAEFRV